MFNDVLKWIKIENIKFGNDFFIFKESMRVDLSQSCQIFH